MFPSAPLSIQSNQRDMMADAWLEQQKREKARRRQAEQATADFQVETERAWSLLEYGRPNEARRVLDGVLARHPGESWALFLFGVCLLRTGDLAHAESVLSEVLGQSPTDHTTAYYLGLARERQGRTAEAHEMYQRALDLRPDFKEARARLEPGPGLRRRIEPGPKPVRAPGRGPGRALLLVILGAAVWVALTMAG
ncbi:MAG TPA: tetratricopeptide repeat protein [Methylomirabilota bacterium]|jgi:tetratricopeptide (TPR) repeat protein